MSLSRKISDLIISSWKWINGIIIYSLRQLFTTLPTLILSRSFRSKNFSISVEQFSIRIDSIQGELFINDKKSGED